ncbi:MAG TPA: hypothetical protein VMA31_11495 [Bryobacteraceae bacterium]|nr:hypothetical protein [Bryobacteraceae bacterium]
MIFFALFFIFLIAWILFWAVFHLVGGAIHVLIALAVLFLIIHFIRRRHAV